MAPEVNLASVATLIRMDNLAALVNQVLEATLTRTAREPLVNQALALLTTTAHQANQVLVHPTTTAAVTPHLVTTVQPLAAQTVPTAAATKTPQVPTEVRTMIATAAETTTPATRRVTAPWASSWRRPVAS